ncbi:Imm1 family immunity protein [Streptomyces sp. NBC_00525]|uniref:Imm1 family immunity protein n=1 Tax=Streptomyces sp. NBC_00525 TaxID=2903660 RepID=UPI002E800A7A|nr:Imm1 family immunity protein [Streptomyces sp. NBC_00525]WUC92148.1 Imm1 family immunity protein [Streptomyces sp. NBC_00525]
MAALKVFKDEQPWRLETEDELKSYLDEIFLEGPNSVPGVATTFQVVDDQIKNEEAPGNVLTIGIDRESGYGAVLWYCDGDTFYLILKEFGEDVAENVWVSFNPRPPEVDPQVVCDPWCPSYFDRFSALPLSVVRSVVEAYFLAGTGFRPQQILWAKGDFTGGLQRGEGEDR